ncbi:MAG: hypothetical protein P4K92_03730, partial [Candidatus Nitrosotalea sp.]|nr:hypothetical protein [Candidatus Nitrosotalea sp.]
MTALIKYEQLTDFQKWFLFYVIKHVTAPKNLNGVMRDMCMTVKMKINVDDFDNEQERLKGEAAQLSEHKLFALTKKYVDNDSYFLTDKGELYVIQKIIKPLF